MSGDVKRREFIKDTLLATAGGALALGAGGAAQAQAQPGAANPEIQPATQDCPKGQIGKLKLSRLIMGSNLITFYIHSRDLKFVNELARRYFTDEKVMETLAQAERNGVDTIMTQDDERYLTILRNYRKQGGKLQWIIAPKITNDIEETRENIRRLVDDGVAALYLHGNPTDKLCAEGKLDFIQRTIEAIKLNDIPAGVGGHDINVVKYCEANKVENDFYVKTFHHHNYKSAPHPEEIVGPYAEVPGYWCKDPVETAAVMQQVKKSFIAFKVMAAGAIPPKSAFDYVLKNGADFVLAGMFEWEIAEDVRLIKASLEAASKRARPWV